MCVHVEVDVSEDAVLCIEADRDPPRGAEHDHDFACRGGGTQDSNMDCE